MKKNLFTFALMLMALGAQAQMKIVTGHPDIRAKLVRCVASDKTVVMDLIFYNEGSKDAKLSVYGGESSYGSTKCFDDDSNNYGGTNIFVAIGNSDLTIYDRSTDFPAETSLKVRVQVENVSLSATEFIRMNFAVGCDAYGISPRKPMKLTHIPITRE